MATTTIQVRRASAGDTSTIASTLARAFFDDPTFCWVYPDEDRRRAVLPGVFALFTQALQRHDEVHLAGDAAGAGLWAPPGTAVVPEEEADEFGRRLAEMSGPDAERLLAVAEATAAHHPQGSHYYLQFMGVEPQSQGRGIGSLLLAGMLERCDREGASAYLEATSPHNRRLYERHGFRVIGEFAPDGGPPLWPMWRGAGA